MNIEPANSGAKQTERLQKHQERLEEAKKREEGITLGSSVPSTSANFLLIFMLAGLGMLILFLAGWQLGTLIFSSVPVPVNQSVSEAPVYVEDLQDNPVLNTAVLLAESNDTLFSFPPSETPTQSLINTAVKISFRSRSATHILSDAFDLTVALQDKISFDIRQNLLSISLDHRALYLNSHLEEITNLLNLSVIARGNLQQAQGELSTLLSNANAKYNSASSTYSSAYNSYDGNTAEQAIRDMAAQSAIISPLTEEIKLLSETSARLEKYEILLRKKQDAIQKNFEALVAGVQVTLISDVDLGLIK